jgi:hypothetical protein
MMKTRMMRMVVLLVLASCSGVGPESAPLLSDMGGLTQSLAGATELWTERSLSTGDLADASRCVAAGRLWAHRSVSWSSNRARIFERTVTLAANQSILVEGHLDLVSDAHPTIGVTARLVISGPAGEDSRTFFAENHMGKAKGTTGVCNDLSDEPNGKLSLHGARVYTAPSAGTYTITLAAVAAQSEAPDWTGACPNGRVMTVPCRHSSSCTLTHENAYLAVATGSAASFLRVYTINAGAAPTQWVANGSGAYAVGSLTTFQHGTYTVPSGVTRASFYSQLAIDCSSAHCTTAGGVTNVRTRLCAGSTSHCTPWSGYHAINQNKHHKQFNNGVNWTSNTPMPLTRAVTPGEQLNVFSQIEVASSGQPATANPSTHGYYAFAYPVLCTPETDQAFCSRHNKNCGSYTDVDSCGALRTANCGSCMAPDTCGCGTPNVCGSCPTCTYGYVDADGDGYGAGAYGCYDGNVVQNNADCCDIDSRVRPGTRTGYSSVNRCGSWDYNCDRAISVTNGGDHYARNAGGAAASYSNGSACTRGTYTGFYRAPSVPITSSSCGTYVKIQPCSWYYYSGTSCTGLIGYHQCTNRLVHCN